MPRPEILEGCGGLVKCNVSMTQITDSDALKRVPAGAVPQIRLAKDAVSSPYTPLMNVL